MNNWPYNQELRLLVSADETPNSSSVVEAASFVDAPVRTKLSRAAKRPNINYSEEQLLLPPLLYSDNASSSLWSSNETATTESKNSNHQVDPNEATSTDVQIVVPRKCTKDQHDHLKPFDFGDIYCNSNNNLKENQSDLAVLEQRREIQNKLRFFLLHFCDLYDRAYIKKEMTDLLYQYILDHRGRFLRYTTAGEWQTLEVSKIHAKLCQTFRDFRARRIAAESLCTTSEGLPSWAKDETAVNRLMDEWDELREEIEQKVKLKPAPARMKKRERKRMPLSTSSPRRKKPRPSIAESSAATTPLVVDGSSTTALAVPQQASTTAKTEAPPVRRRVSLDHHNAQEQQDPPGSKTVVVPVDESPAIFKRKRGRPHGSRSRKARTTTASSSKLVLAATDQVEETPCKPKQDRKQDLLPKAAPTTTSSIVPAKRKRAPPALIGPKCMRGGSRRGRKLVWNFDKVATTTSEDEAPTDAGEAGVEQSASFSVNEEEMASADLSPSSAPFHKKTKTKRKQKPSPRRVSLDWCHTSSSTTLDTIQEDEVAADGDILGSFYEDDDLDKEIAEAYSLETPLTGLDMDAAMTPKSSNRTSHDDEAASSSFQTAKILAFSSIQESPALFNNKVDIASFPLVHNSPAFATSPHQMIPKDDYSQAFDDDDGIHPHSFPELDLTPTKEDSESKPSQFTVFWDIESSASDPVLGPPRVCNVFDLKAQEEEEPSFGFCTSPPAPVNFSAVSSIGAITDDTSLSTNNSFMLEDEDDIMMMESSLTSVDWGISSMPPSPPTDFFMPASFSLEGHIPWLGD